MKLSTILLFCNKPSRRHRFNFRQVAVVPDRRALAVASSASVLIVQVFVSSVLSAPVRVIATVTTSPKNQFSIVTSSSRIAASGGSSSALNNRGLELMKQGNYAAAQTLFTQALQVNPHYAPAYNNRAMIHILMGEETVAIQDYSLSLSLNPNDGDVYYNRGLAYATLDNNLAAIADYTKALQINPRNAQAYHARGGVYLSLNNRAMAHSDFQAAVALYRQQGYQQEYSDLQTFLTQF
jgi:tetratricopeptide (TPR) repeat protein